MRKLLNIKKMRTMLPSILMILATGWFAACSQDEQAGGLEPGEGDMPISFGGAVDNDKEQVAGSRAGLEEGTDGKTTFSLCGYKTMGLSGTGTEADPYGYSDPVKVFNKYTMTYTSGSDGSTSDNTHGWHYVGNGQTLKYWDMNASSYRFMAYAPADASVTHTETAGEVTLAATVDASTAEGEAAAPYISRLWFSNHKNIAYGSPVQMQFVKPFAKVRIMFVNEFGEPVASTDNVCQFTDRKSISFKPNNDTDKIPTAGTVTFTYPLTGTATQETVTVVPTGTTDAITEPYEETVSADAPVFAETAQRWYTVLPDFEQPAYILTLLYNNNERTAIVPAQYMSWVPGFQYTYVFKLTPQGMTFQPQLSVYTKWQTGYVTDQPTQW